MESTFRSQLLVYFKCETEFVHLWELKVLVVLEILNICDYIGLNVFLVFFFFSCFFFSRNCYGKMCALWVSMSLVNLVETELFQKVSEVSFLTNLSCKRFGQKLQIQNFPLKTNEWTFEGYYWRRHFIIVPTSTHFSYRLNAAVQLHFRWCVLFESNQEEQQTTDIPRIHVVGLFAALRGLTDSQKTSLLR